MRKFPISIVAGAALSLAAGGVAAVKAAPPPAPLFTWTGFYVGGNLGRGWSTLDSNSIFTGVGGLVGPATAAVPATPEDTTAPAQPRGLVAVVAGGTVRLAWEAVRDADLAGYLVYRSGTSGRGYEKLTPAPLPGTTFVDAQARPGQTYYYVVTAVDRARRANESTPSEEAAVRMP